MKKDLFYLFFLFIICSCEHTSQNVENSDHLRVVEAHGYVIPQDSTASTRVFFVDENKLQKTPCGNPSVVRVNSNVHPAGEPKVIKAGNGMVATPGMDSFLLPISIIAKDSSFLAGSPEVVVAKDMATKDQNPASFLYFSKLQGLKHEAVSSILKDNLGNLWFGTVGGASKYDGKSFTHFTKKEGLPNNRVLCMLQDKDDNLWFGFNGKGVTKYDGRNFTNYGAKEGLTDFPVFCITEDRHGNIWFATDGGGIIKYNGKTFNHFTQKQGFSTNSTTSIMIGDDNILWIGTGESGFSKFDGKSFTNYTIRDGLSDNRVYRIIKDHLGYIWIATWDGGVNKYDGKTFTNYTVKEGLSSNIIYNLYEDHNTNLWFCTWGGGINKFDGKTFTHFTEKEGLPNHIVTGIMEDHFGNLWFGTTGGVTKYLGKTFTHLSDKDGLHDKNIKCVMQDHKGNLWIGTDFGGLYKYNEEGITWYNKNTGFDCKYVNSIMEDHAGNIWIGTWDGAFKFDGKCFIRFSKEDVLPSNGVLRIIEDRHFNIWFGMLDEGFCKYDGKMMTCFGSEEGLIVKNEVTITESQDGSLWFGTRWGGAYKYDGKSLTRFSQKEGMPDNAVFSIMEDHIGNLWFGTGVGVAKYDGKYFTHFTEKEGLANNTVYSVIEDKSKNLWFGTHMGLSKMKSEKLVNLNKNMFQSASDANKNFFFNYTYEDGFLSLGCNINSIVESKEGTIWIGTKERLTALHPNIEKKGFDAIAPNLQLTEIGLFNEKIHWAGFENSKDSIFTLGNGLSVGNFKFDGISRWYGLPQNLSLAYNNNYLTFKFVGITLIQSSKLKYQYKLEGLDKNWSSLSSINSASFGNLLPGNYTFKVKAMNSEGFWSKEFNYSFTIRPPWWKTWWMYLIYSIIFFLSIGIYSKWRELKLVHEKEKLEKQVELRTNELSIALDDVKSTQEQLIITEKQKEVAIEKTRIARDMHDDIGSGLTKIAILTELLKSGQSQNNIPQIEEISSTANELVDNMSQIIWAMNPENDKLENLFGYLRKYSLDFFENSEIKCELEIPELSLTMPLSQALRRNIFLVIKETLNNIVKYSKAKNVMISVNETSKTLKIIIQDNGIGFDVQKSKTMGNGLTNMQKRMQEIEGEYQITSEPGKGTTTELLITLS